MIFTFPQLISWLEHYKYFVLFPIVVVEGPIITIIGGFLASLGYLRLTIALPVVVAADLVGDSIYYAFGRWGGRRFIDRWGHYFGATAERVEKLEGHFHRHQGKTLVIGKLSHAVVIVILLAAGVARVPYGKFVWYNFIGTLPKSLLFLLIGYYFGRSYEQFNAYLNYYAVITPLIVVAVLVGGY